MAPPEMHGTFSRQQEDRTITSHLVHVNFIQFVEVDAHGQEIAGDRPAAIGYIVYNGEFQEFGQWSFQRSDDYTLESDVYRRIRERHPRLALYVHQMEGFYLSGRWCPIPREPSTVH